MADRSIPPDDIAPTEFFIRWIPANVAADQTRRARLGNTEATLEFALIGEGGGCFTLCIAEGAVQGREGGTTTPDLRVELDVRTWRELNAGTLSAPQALLGRRLQLRGNLALAIKLHLLIG